MRQINTWSVKKCVWITFTFTFAFGSEHNLLLLISCAFFWSRFSFQINPFSTNNTVDKRRCSSSSDSFCFLAKIEHNNHRQIHRAFDLSNNKVLLIASSNAFDLNAIFIFFPFNSLIFISMLSPWWIWFLELINSLILIIVMLLILILSIRTLICLLA